MRLWRIIENTNTRPPRTLAIFGANSNRFAMGRLGTRLVYTLRGLPLLNIEFRN